MDIERLRAIPIEGVAERLGLRVTRHMSLCPFHDDHRASLSYHVGRNVFRCFVCDEKGDVIDLVRKRLSMGFTDACRWLADAGGVIMEEYRPRSEKPPKPFDVARYARYFERPFLGEEARRFLYTERMLDPRVVGWCRLSSWRGKDGTPWLQIPYYDREYRLTGVQSRNLVKGAEPRFRFPQGAECGIYNLPILNRLHEGDELYISEGCSDCWALLSAGHKAIAIPSATLLKGRDAALFDKLAPLDISYHMYPDRDLPGERLFLQLKEMLPGIVRHDLPEYSKDFADYWRRSRELWD